MDWIFRFVWKSNTNRGTGGAGMWVRGCGVGWVSKIKLNVVVLQIQIISYNYYVIIKRTIDCIRTFQTWRKPIYYRCGWNGKNTSYSYTHSSRQPDENPISSLCYDWVCLCIVELSSTYPSFLEWY